MPSPYRRRPIRTKTNKQSRSAKSVFEWQKLTMLHSLKQKYTQDMKPDYQTYHVPCFSGVVRQATAKCRLVPTVKQSWCGNYHILIVSAIKICKQCLQTASPSPYRALPLDPTPQICGLQPPNENSWCRHSPVHTTNLWSVQFGMLPKSVEPTSALSCQTPYENTFGKITEL